MNSKSKHLITSGVIAAVIFLIMVTLTGTLVSVVIAALAGSVTYWLFSSRNSESTADKSSEAELTSTDVANQALLLANLQLRKHIVSAELRENYESLIDQLIELLPLVNENGFESELSWVINRMATEYLPNKSITPYLNLSETERLNSDVISGVLENISSMRKELQDVKDMVTRKNTSEFSQKAKFLSQRFTEK